MKPGYLFSIAALASVASSAVQAQARDYHVSLPAQSLSRSLYQVSQVTGLQIVFNDSAITHAVARPIEGTYTAHSMLAELLDQSGYAFDIQDSIIRVYRDGARPFHRLAMVSPATPPRMDAAEQNAAPSPSAETRGANDIIVTAQKREQNIQDIGIAVTALGQQDIAGMGQRDVRALVQQVPSLQVTQYSPTLTVFNIRGVSQADVADGHEAPIAFYNDEVYVAAPGAISGHNFDLERVEVLRGPQSTLFGRNATGGLIQVVTAKPSDKSEGYVTLAGGSHNQIASEMAVSGPLTDAVRGRFSFATNHHDGYIRNTLGGPNGSNARYYAGRAQLEFDVGSTGTLRLKAEHIRNDHETAYFTSQPASFDADGLGIPLPRNVDFWTGRILRGRPVASCQGCDASGFLPPESPLAVTADTRGVADRKYWSGTVFYEQQLGSVTLTSLSNYQDLKKIFIADSDVSPRPIFDVDTSQNLYQYSQELRLSGSGGGLTWVAGVYGLKIRSRNFSRLGTPRATVTLFPAWAEQAYRQDTRSLAAFGQVEYALSDMLTVIAGLRYTNDKKDNDWRKISQFPFAPPLIQQFNTALYPDLAKIDYDDYSGKIGIDFKPSEDTLIYASVNRGIKSGGFITQAFFFDPATMPYKEEVLTSYEGGFKLTLADRRLNLNGAAFYYDYDGYQAFTRPRAGETIVQNKPATISGIELEAHARPIDWLTISPWVTRLFKAEVRNITLPLGRVVDRRMPQAPDWSAGVSASLQVPLGTGVLGMWTNWKYNSAQYFTTFNSALTREQSYIVGDLRLSYAAGGLEGALFVNNVTNKRYRLYVLDLATDQGSGEVVPAPPRWWGVSLTYRFGVR